MPAHCWSPDTFDIHRPDLGTARSFTAAARHLAFGTGLHQCVGAAFARAEIETVAAMLLPLLDQVRYSPGFRYRETGLYTRGPVSLSLDFTPSTKAVPATKAVADLADADAAVLADEGRFDGPTPPLTAVQALTTSADRLRS